MLVFSFACSFSHCSLTALFFFNDTATTEIYTLSLHDALPISRGASRTVAGGPRPGDLRGRRQLRHSRDAARQPPEWPDRKSTRLNSVTATSRMPSSA